MNTQPPSAPGGWQALHGAIMLSAMMLLAVCTPGLGWPWYLLGPTLIYFLLVLLVPVLRRGFPRIALGRVNAARLAAAIILSVLSTAALLSYQAIFQPDLKNAAERLPRALLGSMLLAGIGFSVLNALLEELIFRWNFYEAIAAEWGQAGAAIATAFVFGLAHWQGYPPGVMGAVLAGLYGLALGLLRWWSGGLALGFACHVTADATIFAIIASVS